MREVGVWHSSLRFRVLVCVQVLSPRAHTSSRTPLETADRSDRPRPDGCLYKEAGHAESCVNQPPGARVCVGRRARTKGGERREEREEEGVWLHPRPTDLIGTTNPPLSTLHCVL